MNIFDDDNDFKYIKNKNFGQIQTKVNNFQFYSCSSFFFFFFFFGKKKIIVQIELMMMVMKDDYWYDNIGKC